MTADRSPSDPDLDGPPSVLALHGLGGGSFEFGGLLGAFERAGAAVLAPTLPGHAVEVDGSMMPASRWEDWASASESAFDELIRARPDRPVVAVGFSTGGTLALWLATRRPVSKLVLLAPFLAIRFGGLIPIRASRWLGPIAWAWPDLPRRPAPIRDRSARRAVDAVARFRTFSLPATLSALELIERVKPLVPEIRTPTLILQGGLDSVVEPSASSWLARTLGSPRKRLIAFPRSDHLLALDRDRDRVIAEALAFALGTDEG